MNETTTQELPPRARATTAAPLPLRPRDRRRLRRLGRYFNVDPIIFRIGAVVLVFVGGAGLLAYLAALLLIPSEDSPAAAAGAPAGATAGS